MTRRQVRATRRVGVAKLPDGQLKGFMFANEFLLSDSGRSYNGLKYVLKNGQKHTTLKPGRHQFSVECEGTKNFLRLLEWYPLKDKMELKAVHVVETGLSNHIGIFHHFDAVEEGTLRILINLREEGASHSVGLGNTIKQGKRKIDTWTETCQSYATVLPGVLSDLTIMVGNDNIPTMRQTNGRSLYVIMDIHPLKDAEFKVAENIFQQSGDDKKSLADKIRRLRKENKISDEQLEEMMKDPETAFKRIIGDEAQDTEMDAPNHTTACDEDETDKSVIIAPHSNTTESENGAAGTSKEEVVAA